MFEKEFVEAFFGGCKSKCQQRTRTSRSATITICAYIVVAGLVAVVHRVDRVLRSAPHVLIQPLDVVEKRLSHLRKVLGLAPSPELEKVRETTPPVPFFLPFVLYKAVVRTYGGEFFSKQAKILPHEIFCFSGRVF